MKKKYKKYSKATFLSFEKNVKIINFKDLSKLKKKTIFDCENKRFCLHNQKKDRQQEMIICQKKNNFFPPKKNTISDQSFLILEGKLLIVTFDKFGNITSKILLSKNSNLFARVKKNTYHCDIPMSNIAIHLETKNCIFNNKVNKIAKFHFDPKRILLKTN
jgi:cupin fold WbuC family metalloprotein